MNELTKEQRKAVRRAERDTKVIMRILRDVNAPRRVSFMATPWGDCLMKWDDDGFHIKCPNKEAMAYLKGTTTTS